MEQQIQSQESPLFGLSIDPLIKAHLAETARWGRFLAIIGFICCALIVIAGLFVTTMMNSLRPSYGYGEGASLSAFGPAIAIFYILFAVLYFFPCLFLLRFSTKMKTALEADNQADLTVSFQNLKVLFRYVGILTIIVLAFYLLALVFGGLGVMMGR